MPDTDQTMLELFRAEVESHAPAISEGLLILERDPTQTKPLEAMMRAAHSIKGAARIVGVEPAVRLAHVLEDYFVAVQAGKVRLDSNVTDMLLRGVDTLTRVALEPDWQVDNEDEFQATLAMLGELKDGRCPEKTVSVSATVPGAVPEPVPDKEPVLFVRGDLDADRAEKLRPIVCKLLRERVASVRLDFTDVRDMDPWGLAFLAAIAQAVRKEGLDTMLHVTGASPEIRDVLHMTRLDQAFQPG